MIVVKNRELVIPNTEYNLGTNYDNMFTRNNICEFTNRLKFSHFSTSFHMLYQ